MGVLQILNTGCPVRIVETLNIERVEGIDVESQLDPFSDRECLVYRQVGDVVERPGQHRMRERIHALRAGRIAVFLRRAGVRSRKKSEWIDGPFQ